MRKLLRCFTLTLRSWLKRCSIGQNQNESGYMYYITSHASSVVSCIFAVMNAAASTALRTCLLFNWPRPTALTQLKESACSRI